MAYGIDLRDYVIDGSPKNVASHRVFQTDVLGPAAVSICLPSANWALPGVLGRMRIRWGGGGVSQELVCDLRSCLATFLTTYVSVDVWLEQELRSDVVAGTAVANQILPAGASVLIGPAGAISHSVHSYTTQVYDVVGATNLGIVPNWARRVSLWEPRAPAAPTVPTNAPQYRSYGGVAYQPTERSIARAFQQIELKDLWHKYAILGPGFPPGGNMLWSSGLAPSGAPEVQLCYELEV